MADRLAVLDLCAGQVRLAGRTTRHDAAVDVGVLLVALKRGAAGQGLKVFGAGVGIARSTVAAGAAMPWEFRGIDAVEPDACGAASDRVTVDDLRAGAGECGAADVGATGMQVGEAAEGTDADAQGGEHHLRVAPTSAAFADTVRLGLEAFELTPVPWGTFEAMYRAHENLIVQAQSSGKHAFIVREVGRSGKAGFFVYLAGLAVRSFGDWRH